MSVFSFKNKSSSISQSLHQIQPSPQQRIPKFLKVTLKDFRTNRQSQINNSNTHKQYKSVIKLGPRKQSIQKSTVQNLIRQPTKFQNVVIYRQSPPQFLQNRPSIHKQSNIDSLNVHQFKEKTYNKIIQSKQQFMKNIQYKEDLELFKPESIKSNHNADNIVEDKEQALEKKLNFTPIVPIIQKINQRLRGKSLNKLSNNQQNMKQIRNNEQQKITITNQKEKYHKRQIETKKQPKYLYSQSNSQIQIQKKQKAQLQLFKMVANNHSIVKQTLNDWDLNKVFEKIKRQNTPKSKWAITVIQQAKRAGNRRIKF